MMEYQGVHWPDMFDMGYGYGLDDKGMVNCSCVADNASTADGMLEGVRYFPSLPETPKVLGSVRRYIDYCLNSFLTVQGVMGVGVLNHQVNPKGMEEYWCANALFAAALIRFAELTEEAKYYDAAVPMIEYISTYDYKNTLWKEWAAPQQIILYTSEGLVRALASAEMKKRLQKPPAGVIQFSPVEQAQQSVVAQADNQVLISFSTSVQAQDNTIWARLVARFTEFCRWLYDNQTSEGFFEHPQNAHHLCYEPGLAWILLDAAKNAEGFGWLESVAAKQLLFMSTDKGKLHYGLCANDFATGLSMLSFATAGEMLKARDPEGWEAALQEVFANGEAIW
jgi:hypothetical protein